MAISFFIAYILLVFTLFQSIRLTEAWSIAKGGTILGLSLCVACFVPYFSVAKRSAMLGECKEIHVHDSCFAVVQLWTPKCYHKFSGHA